MSSNSEFCRPRFYVRNMWTLDKVISRNITIIDSLLAGECNQALHEPWLLTVWSKIDHWFITTSRTHIPTQN